MVTDWLHNPRVAGLLPLGAAAICAVLLAVTRRRLPPEEPRWRLVRALTVVAFWTGMVTARIGVIGDLEAQMLLMPPLHSEMIEWLPLLAHGLGVAVFFGWLIPWGMEGRSLREMGWQGPAVRYFLVSAVLTLLVAAVRPLPAVSQNLQEMPGTANVSAAAILRMPVALVWVLVVGFVFTGWAEENLFRGHLLPAFREVGLNARGANIAQAMAFVTIHLPGLPGILSDIHAEFDVAGTVAAAVALPMIWWLWGLLFGWLRLRFDSIVPGFAVHGTFNAVTLARQWAALLLILYGVSPPS